MQPQFEYYYYLPTLPLFSMWYKGESVGRLQLRLLLIKKGIEGGNHTIKEWKNIFLSIGIVFNNPEKQIKKNAAAPPPSFILI